MDITAAAVHTLTAASAPAGVPAGPSPASADALAAAQFSQLMGAQSAAVADAPSAAKPWARRCKTAVLALPAAKRPPWARASWAG